MVITGQLVNGEINIVFKNPTHHKLLCNTIVSFRGLSVVEQLFFKRCTDDNKKPPTY